MSFPEPPREYVLGIDLGCNSLGWAIIELIDDVPSKLFRAGVRIFPAGVNIDVKSGREKTLNAQRREARQARRQCWRRRRRLVKVAHVLKHAGLLPNANLSDPSTRQRVLNDLDKEIFVSEWFRASHPVCSIPRKDRTVDEQLEFDRIHQRLPYILRASALRERLEPRFLGRALYHLAQRRGFWSPKSTPEREDDNFGKVEPAIKTLRERLDGQTLGQYFAKAPLGAPVRGPENWAARDMYQAEFKAIWAHQKQYHPFLTEEIRQELYDAIFDQRPLKLKKNAIGECEFERTARRAPAYLLDYQRFRLLQSVNNFKVRTRGGEWTPLPAPKRARLIAELDRRSYLDFNEIRDIHELGLTQAHSINFQRNEKQTHIRGNDTAAQFLKIFGERWFAFTEEEQERIVADTMSILSVRDADARRNRARKYLSNKGVVDLEEPLDELLRVKLESGYGSLSVHAIRRFLPLLEAGFPYGALSSHYRHLQTATPELIRLVESGLSHEAACSKVLTQRPERNQEEKSLPPVLCPSVQTRIGAVRNPIVIRSLTELRKVVNAIVEKFGKPRRVNIELLRELKKPKDAREKIWKENIRRESHNQSIEAHIREVAPHIGRVTPRDVEKYRLWQEGQLCPYCTSPHPMTERLLFGSDSEYQVDHIIPFSMSLDDSLANKLLCHASCNQAKGDMTPFQRFARTEDWEEMLARVSKLKGDYKDEKLRRFKMDGKALEEFLAKRPSQQFNDSAYASRAAAEYVALLYGGRTDDQGNLRVQVRSGGLTKYFRDAWKLNDILGDGPTANGGKTIKPRHDHRHHAIDAAVIAATDQAMVHRLNDAAKMGGPLGASRGRWKDDFRKGPWVDFKTELQNTVRRIVVSHRVSGKVSGPLHKDTNYSPKEYEGKRRHRIKLEDLSEKDVHSDHVIPDPALRRIIRAKLEQLGGKDPGEAFADRKNLPEFKTKRGLRVPIKTVRIQEPVGVRRIGKRPERARYVKPGGNHHLEIFGQEGKDGRDKKWDTPGVVTMLDAYERLSNQEPIVRKHFGEGWQFRFSLAQGDLLMFGSGPDQGKYFVVRGISEEIKRACVKVEMTGINDARRKKEIKKRRESGQPMEWVTKSPNELLKLQARKVRIDPLGDVSEAHD